MYARRFLPCIYYIRSKKLLYKIHLGRSNVYTSTDRRDLSVRVRSTIQEDFMNCLCNLFNNENLIWIIIIALLIVCFSNNGNGCGCGCS